MMYEKERTDIAYFMRRLYRQGLTTTSGGNISCRLPDGLMAITASKLDKCDLQADGVAVIASDGNNLTQELKPSIETGMHAAIYRKRPDVHAIVHAHPVTATAFCASRDAIDTHITAEAYAILCEPVFIPYALMGTPRLAELVADGIGDAQCALMENHGIITVGATLLDAFDKLELLEAAARQTLLCRQMSSFHPLTQERLDELDRFVGRI